MDETVVTLYVVFGRNVLFGEFEYVDTATSYDETQRLLYALRLETAPDGMGPRWDAFTIRRVELERPSGQILPPNVIDLQQRYREGELGGPDDGDGQRV